MFLQPAVLDQMHDAVIVTDLAGLVTGCNRAVRRIYGYAPEELIGQNVGILYAEENRQILLDRVVPQVREAGEFHGEICNRTRAGEYIYIHLSVTLLRDGDGKPAGMVGFSVDVTTQKLADLALRRNAEIESQLSETQSQQHNAILEKLRESDTRLRRLTESLPQLLWTANAAGQCTYVSNSCSTYLGMSIEDCKGAGWWNAIHPDDIGNTAKKWFEAVEKTIPFDVEYRLRRHDGKFFPFTVRAIATLNEDGSVAEWVGSCTDISELKRTEEALRLTEKLAAVGRLASSISHEINNPLESVTNLLYLLETNRSLDSTARAYLKSATEQLARVSEVTTQTLRFYRQSSMATHTRIPELIDSILSLHSPQMNTMNIKVKRDYRSMPELVCFSGEIRQLLANIIGNSLDAMRRGGTLILRARASRDWDSLGRRGVRITVADSGHGIAQADISRIFEAFFTTKGINGSGLGLWIAKNIVGRHEGSISIRSSDRRTNSGTVVSIFIPFERKSATQTFAMGA